MTFCVPKTDQKSHLSWVQYRSRICSKICAVWNRGCCSTICANRSRRGGAGSTGGAVRTNTARAASAEDAAGSTTVKAIRERSCPSDREAERTPPGSEMLVVATRVSDQEAERTPPGSAVSAAKSRCSASNRISDAILVLLWRCGAGIKGGGVADLFPPLFQFPQNKDYTLPNWARSVCRVYT